MKSCLESYQTHVDEVILIQTLLSDINNDNLQTTIATIKSTKLYQDKESMKILMQSIGIFSKIRRKQIHLYFDLIDDIISKIIENFNKIEIMSLFKKKDIHLKLFKDGIISIEDIASYYGYENTKLSFFYPEMKSLFTKYPLYQEQMNDVQRFKNVIEMFSQKGSENISAKEDPRLQVGNLDRLSISIQNDDIDEFQQILSLNNIDIQSHKINLNSFESNKCLKEEKIYLIEYASYHGSLKIFKFLLMNNAPFSRLFLQYAICGGVNEIIHLAESAIKQGSIEQEMENILFISVIFHRYDISEYLINSYDIKLDSNCFSASLMRLNYSFFINHILEFEDEYNKLYEASKKSDDPNVISVYEKKRNEVTGCVLFSSGMVDSFFLKMFLNFENIDYNHSNEYIVNDSIMFNPLVFAIQSLNNNNNVKILLSIESVDHNIKMMYNMSPFLWACYVGNFEIVELFINKYFHSKQIDWFNILQITDESGENALHLATRESHLDVVKYLVSLNVFDLSMKNFQGESVIETAARLGYKDMFEYLKTQFIKDGIEFDKNLIVNEQKYLPTTYRSPNILGYKLFDNLKEPIPVCLLI